MNDELKRVYVISAPSGAGKTTLARMLTKDHPKIETSISLTCREKRAGEVDGKDYHFVTQDEFQKAIDSGDMLEWANVHGNLYGTSKSALRQAQDRGHFSLLEIDVQGWHQARQKLKKATAIFILPPNIHSLWQRLEDRGTDSESTRWRRLLNARKEIENASYYDFFIINNDLQSAYQELEDIIIMGKKGEIGPDKGREICQNLLAEFETQSWLRELREKFG